MGFMQWQAKVTVPCGMELILPLWWRVIKLPLWSCPPLSPYFPLGLPRLSFHLGRHLKGLKTEIFSLTLCCSLLSFALQEALDCISLFMVPPWLAQSLKVHPLPFVDGTNGFPLRRLYEWTEAFAFQTLALRQSCGCLPGPGGTEIYSKEQRMTEPRQAQARLTLLGANVMRRPAKWLS